MRLRPTMSPMRPKASDMLAIMIAPMIDTHLSADSDTPNSS